MSLHDHLQHKLGNHLRPKQTLLDILSNHPGHVHGCTGRSPGGFGIALSWNFVKYKRQGKGRDNIGLNHYVIWVVSYNSTVIKRLNPKGIQTTLVPSISSSQAPIALLRRQAKALAPKLGSPLWRHWCAQQAEVSVALHPQVEGVDLGSTSQQSTKNWRRKL